MTKGLKRLYECEECHARRMVAWVELNRAAKPKCSACGCTRLELVSEEAKKDLARLNHERLVNRHGSFADSLAESGHRPGLPRERH